MANERWNSPFPHTIAFVLFKEHFTELNYVYWAHVPAASTIEKKALEALKSEDADPKRYFLIPDKDDRRIPKTYAQWKSFYREFSNYTRLNMLMLLSSCFETYLRTIVSLSLESKPGIIIKAPDAVDGWFLFRKNSNYGNYGSKDYQFLEEIGSVCQGDWNSRANAYIKYFGNMPLSATEISELDDDEKKMFLEDLGLTESGLEKLVKASYHLLGLMSFLTSGEDETRAWTIKIGTKAPQAAGKIHTDFERGFIKAEVVNYQDLLDCGSYAGAREKGLVRMEGKDYVVQDGDVILFRFNV